MFTFFFLVTATITALGFYLLYTAETYDTAVHGYCLMLASSLLMVFVFLLAIAVSN